MEFSTDADYMHVERVCKEFEIKDLDEYHDFYLTSDKWILADLFKNFRKTCLRILTGSEANSESWQSSKMEFSVKIF